MASGEIRVFRGVHDGDVVRPQIAHVHLHIQALALLVLGRVNDFILQRFPCSAKIGQKFRAEGIVAEVAVANSEQRAFFLVARAGVELRQQSVCALQ